MLPIIIFDAMLRNPNNFARFSSSFHRSFATAPPSTTPSASKSSSSHTPLVTKSSSADPPLITGMPKMNIPAEYQGLLDVKQEPGYVIVNGKRYPYPYPGIHKEYNYLQLLDKWRQEGKVNPHNEPKFRKMKGREKILAKQLWFQRDPTTPVHKLGKYDGMVNGIWISVMFFVIMLGAKMTYRVIVPKEHDIFNGDNWDRWHREAKH